MNYSRESGVRSSTAARNLSERTAHISKLTEAAWIQDVRSARARRQRTLELFRDYRAAVDAIRLLRAFREPGKMPNRYQLIEIPGDLFKSLEDVPDSAFRGRRSSDRLRLRGAFFGSAGVD